MMMQAEEPSESWLALPAVMLVLGPSTGFSAARPSSLVSGRLPSSLSSVISCIVTLAGFLVLDAHRRGDGDDLGGEAALGLGGGGALLRAERIFVLRFAR